jgi:spermidine/putrescine transport system substrate-binding protein
MFRKYLSTIAFIGILITLVGCSAQAAQESTSVPPELAEELIYYDWEEDMPQSVLDAFSEEFGVEVTYLTYETQEEALANIKAGEIYDVVVVDNDIVPAFLEGDLLAEIDYRNVPNYKNISANFRDLAYDPGNEHSIPWNWGTTGLVVRSDLVEKPITRWADLWDPSYTGKIAMRVEPRELTGIALKSLGYSINSENPDELIAAEERILELKDRVIFVEAHAEDAIPQLVSGEVVILVGWGEDVLYGREEHEAITYILPEEGTFLWGDNFVIPANSPRKYTAELFLNFLMRPEINAMIINENFYASANEAARAFVDPEISDDPAIFPTPADLANAEVYLPLSPQGEERYNEILEHFVAVNQ